MEYNIHFIRVSRYRSETLRLASEISFDENLNALASKVTTIPLEVKISTLFQLLLACRRHR